MDFRMNFSISAKKRNWDCIESVDCFERKHFLKIILIGNYVLLNKLVFYVFLIKGKLLSKEFRRGKYNNDKV